MKLTMILLLGVLFPISSPQQQDSLVVMFWNVENFYDWKDGGLSDSDRDFSAGGSRHWTSKRFYSKSNAIAKIILKAGEVHGRLPDAVGFAEVENSFVLRALLSSTLLRKLDYSYLHFDSPDRRGIDCALIYRKSSLRIRNSFPAHLYDSSGCVMKTRDILVACFDGLDILVNHHPSKVGEGSSESRKTAMERMFSLCDSLRSEGHAHILSIGDFNDDVWDSDRGTGTHKYHGGWEKIDGCFHYGLSVDESIFSDPSLSEKDKSWGGIKPRRCYVGPRWNGGVSDHYPIVMCIKKEMGE